MVMIAPGVDALTVDDQYDRSPRVERIAKMAVHEAHEVECSGATATVMRPLAPDLPYYVEHRSSNVAPSRRGGTMSNSLLKRFGLLTQAGSAQAALASEAGDGQSSEVFGGFLILLGAVVLAYAFVFLLRILAGSKKLGPDKMHAVEFDEFTRSIDDPNWRVPDSWPKR